MKYRMLIVRTLIIFSILVICYLTFENYDQKSRLAFNLHIRELPKSLKIINYHDYGISDFKAEWYVSIDPKDFQQLIIGRKFVSDFKFSFVADVIPEEYRYSFPAEICYSTGTAYNGIKVYSNKKKSLLYIVENIN